MKPDSSACYRSIMKGLTWETISLVLTFFIAWLLFGQVETCLIFAFISFIVKLGAFYGHERLWHQSTFGKR